jgi:hypothetical protein
MALTDCCSNRFAALSRAAAKSLSAKMRAIGLGSVRRDWASRASICESCHLRVVVRGISYCGTPLLRQIDRDPFVDGCGCPTRVKAMSPHEHCPLNRRNQPASSAGECDCKWCEI